MISYPANLGTVARTVTPEPAAWPKRLLWCLALLAALIASRAPLTPRYLITFDSINFALAVDQFNPALQQPQPPGYPLFVFLLKLLSFFVPPAQALFFVAGVLLSLAALLLLWKLGDALLGPGRGLIAALLLLFHPAFWLSPLTNPVRLGYAVGAPAVALCLCLALDRGSQRWFLIAAASLGIASGLRPDLTIILAPLVLWSAFRLRLRWRTLAAALLVYLCAVAVWLPALVAAAGGWQAYYTAARDYSVAQAHATSVQMGGGLLGLAQMAWTALVWSCLGILSWIWALPAVLRRRRADRFPAGRLLLWWFLPGLLFYSVCHVGDPDHTLSIVPATCLAGAAALFCFTRDFSAPARATAIGAAVLLNVLLFFQPLSKAAVASTYQPVEWLDRYMAGVIDTISGLQDQQGGVTVIVYEPVAGWRHISYYVPDSRLMVIRNYTGDPASGWQIRHKQSRDWHSVDGAFRVPACGALAWIDPDVRPVHIRGASRVYRTHPVSFTRPAAGEIYEYRGLRFLATTDGCPAAR